MEIIESIRKAPLGQAGEKKLIQKFDETVFI